MLNRSASLKLTTFFAYAACIAVVTSGLFHARRVLIETYGTNAAQSSWRQWRDAASQEGGPVDRDEPKSELPPTFVLMQDHFEACLGFSLLMTTVLFLTLVFMIRGAFFYEHPAAYQTDSET